MGIQVLQFMYLSFFSNPVYRGLFFFFLKKKKNLQSPNAFSLEFAAKQL